MAKSDLKEERRTSYDEVLGRLLTAQLDTSKHLGNLSGHVERLREDVKRLPCMDPEQARACPENQDIGTVVRIVSKYWKKGTAAVAAVAAAAGFVWAFIASLWK